MYLDTSESQLSALHDGEKVNRPLFGHLHRQKNIYFSERVNVITIHWSMTRTYHPYTNDWTCVYGPMFFLANKFVSFDAPYRWKVETSIIKHQKWWDENINLKLRHLVRFLKHKTFGSASRNLISFHSVSSTADISSMCKVHANMALNHIYLPQNQSHISGEKEKKTFWLLVKSN